MIAVVTKEWEKAWQEVAATITALKQKTGQPALGLVLTDVPPELVHAAKALPLALLGKEVPFLHADKHLQAFACSYARSVIERSENGELDFLDGLIIPYACDTTRCLDLIFKYMNKYKFVECLRLPKRTSGEGVHSYFQAELIRLGKALADFTGTPISAERLAASIALYNQVRRLLEELRTGLRRGAAGFSAREYFSAVRLAMVLPPEESLPLLQTAAAAIKSAPTDEVKKKKPGVVVAGKMAEPPAVVELIEEAGLRLVEDHLVVGGRWVAGVVPEEGDPWETLVKRQLEMLPFAGIWDNRPSRGSFLFERVKETGSAGALLLLQKFCEPAELDRPGIQAEAAQQGIPLLLLETDLSDSNLAQVRTSLEAFAEML